MLTYMDIYEYAGCIVYVVLYVCVKPLSFQEISCFLRKIYNFTCQQTISPQTLECFPAYKILFVHKIPNIQFLDFIFSRNASETSSAQTESQFSTKSKYFDMSRLPPHISHEFPSLPLRGHISLCLSLHRHSSRKCLLRRARHRIFDGF